MEGGDSVGVEVGDSSVGVWRVGIVLVWRVGIVLRCGGWG